MKALLTWFAALFLFTTTARAGTFSTTAWNNDASMGFVAGQTWAFHFGSTTQGTVNGTTVLGAAGPVESNPLFDLTGTTTGTADASNNITGTGAALMAQNFVYGGNPVTITVKGLTPGSAYTVSLFSVGWTAGQTRVQTFASGEDSLVMDPQQFGENFGLRVDYAFIAAAATRVITITPQLGTNTFHLYGLALRRPDGTSSLTVTNASNAGAGSLRQALTNAAATPGSDIVTFDPALSGATITLSGEIVINDTTGGVTVDATSLPAGLTLSGNNATRHFTVGPGKTLALAGLTLTGGNGAGTAQNGNGNAIANLGNLILTRCTLTGNASNGGSGGALLNDGGAMALTHCTLTGNFGFNGGAIFQSTGDLALTHCTISGNQTVGTGGAIYKAGGTLTLTNCIATGNGFEANIEGTPVLNGANLTSGDPLLGPLGNYGGSTKTMLPLPGSPAIDAATVIAGLTTDQRGLPRNLDGDSTPGSAPDLGAAEFGRAVVTTAVDESTTPASGGAGLSLREALRDGADLILFAPGLTGPIVLGSQLEVAKYVTIDAGSFAHGVTVHGNLAVRVFHIAPGVSAGFVRLSIASGKVAGAGFPSGYGGGVFVEGALVLTECTLSGNSAFAGGGACVAGAGASLTLQRCTVSNNEASYGGGIQNESTLLCQSCSFAENTASVEGGAISAPFARPVTLHHCTLSFNSAAKAGGTTGTIAMSNSILCGNTAPDAPNYSGTLVLNGNWLYNVDALLAPLGDYGGPTRTMALLPGSPARDHAVPFAPVPATDQRGFPIAGPLDIGAYEAGTHTNYNAFIWETLPATATVLQHLSTADYDADGSSNLDEFIAGTTAADPASVFRTVPTRSGANLLLLALPTATGRTYTLQSSDTLAPGGWTNTGLFLPGYGAGITFTLPATVPGVPHRFFRVVISMP